MPYTPPLIQTSAQLAAQLSDETGTGSNVFATSPTLVTPILGTPSAGTLSNCDVATDSVPGVMSAANHTTLTALSGQASGVAPPFVAVGLAVAAFKTGVDFKNNATIDIFTVPASRNFICTTAYIIPTSVTGGAAVSIVWKIIESGASGSMTTVGAAGSAAPVTTKTWTQPGCISGGTFVPCATGNKVQFSITTAWTTSTTVTGTVFVLGYYAT